MKKPGNEYTPQQRNDYANQRNPNSAAHKAGVDNRSVQIQRSKIEKRNKGQ